MRRCTIEPPSGFKLNPQKFEPLEQTSVIIGTVSYSGWGARLHFDEVFPKLTKVTQNNIQYLIDEGVKFHLAVPLIVEQHNHTRWSIPCFGRYNVIDIVFWRKETSHSSAGQTRIYVGCQNDLFHAVRIRGFKKWIERDSTIRALHIKAEELPDDAISIDPRKASRDIDTYLSNVLEI